MSILLELLIFAPLLYQIPLLAAYGFLAVVVILYRPELKLSTSLIWFFVMSFIMNFVTLANSFVIDRVGAYTGINGTMSSWYNNHDVDHAEQWVWLTLCHWFQHNATYSQYLYHTCFALNRLTGIMFPVESEPCWKQFFFLVLVIVFAFPMVFTWPLIIGKSFYKYSNTYDFYYIDSTYTRKDIYVKMAPFMIIDTFINFGINVRAYTVYKQQNRKNSRNFSSHQEEQNGFGRTLRKIIQTDLLIDVIPAVVAWADFYINVYSTPDENEFSFRLLSIVKPIVGDILTLSPPCLLLRYSTVVRRKFGQLVPCFRRCGPNGTVNTISSTVSVQRISRIFT